VFPTSLPAAGSEVTTDDYSERVCGTKTVGVDVGLELTVDCAASTEQYQYVMIQSVDTSAEKLCIAEVCVYTTSQYAITIVLVGNRRFPDNHFPGQTFHGQFV